MSGRARILGGRKVLKKVVEKIQHPREIVPFETAKTFLITYGMDKEGLEQKPAEHLAERLRQRGKDVVLLGYLAKSRKNTELPPDDHRHVYISRKDFNLMGLPSSIKVKKFLTRKFDYLISLSMEFSAPLKSIAGLNKSGCRIGFYNEKFIPYFDLLLGHGEERSLSKYIADIEHYLKLLK